MLTAALFIGRDPLVPALQKSQEEETDANSFLHVLWRRAGRAPRGGGAAAELTTEHKAPLGQEASANPEVLGTV